MRRGASIGANANWLFGANDPVSTAFVAAGAVITREVPAYALMMGTPKIVGWMSKAGGRLGEELICPTMGLPIWLTAPDKLEEMLFNERIFSAYPIYRLGGPAKINQTANSMRLSKVLDHGQYIMGPEVEEIEGQLRGV